VSRVWPETIWFVNSGSILLSWRKATLANANSLPARHPHDDEAKINGVLDLVGVHQQGNAYEL
jgi:hypothetical protein